MSNTVEKDVVSSDPKIKSLGNVSRPSWEKIIFDQYNLHLAGNYRTFAEQGKEDNGRQLFSQKGGEYQLLNTLVSFDQKIFTNPTAPDLRELMRKEAYTIRKVRDLKARGNLNLIVDAIGVSLSNYPDEKSDSYTSASRFYGMQALYLLACDPQRFLVGAKDGIHTKRVELQGVETPGGTLVDLFYLAESYIGALFNTGKSELEVIPTRMVPRQVLDKVQLPKPRADVADLMNYAFEHQRYEIPEEGAEFKFSGALDAKSMFLVQRANIMTSRLDTEWGQGLIHIYTNGMTWLDPNRIGTDEKAENSGWAYLVAETIRDFMVEKKVALDRPKLLTPPKTVTLGPVEEGEQHPYYIWIPRKRYNPSEGDPRIKFVGERRKPREHEVVKSFPKKPITKRHLRFLEKWFADRNEEMPEIPEGHTYRRPHRRGLKAMEEKQPPIYIRTEKSADE